MIRTRHIVPKSAIFKLVGHPKISKVEILTSAQQTLQDPEICSIYVYHRVDWSLCLTTIGNCLAMVKMINQHRKDFNYGPNNVKFEKGVGQLSGFASLKSAGFISSSHITKMLKFEKDFDCTLRIPSEILRIHGLQEAIIDELLAKLLK